ncbi:HD domain-containing protein [bacterium]|nr:HD domain-containing protein [bacterium]
MSKIVSNSATSRFSQRRIKQLLATIARKKITSLFGMKVVGFFDERYVLRSILDRLFEAAQATKGIILVIEEERQRLEFYEARGVDLSLASIQNLAWSIQRLQQTLPAGLDKTHVFAEQTLAAGNDFQFEKALGFKSLCFQPLSMDGQILGAVLLGNRKKSIDFTHADVAHLAAEAMSAGQELERAWLYRELKSMLINMMHAFVSTIEAKDKYTCGHSERVTKYSLQMATLLGWKPETLDLLRMSAILHDIGKIGVPEAILLKPEKLTESEYSIIKNHPIHGAHIVDKVPQFQAALPGILFHHERFDGRGYPHGLGGKDIPEFGRLIAVADAYDAMTGERPYRQCYSHEDAVAEVKANCIKQFDPEMVEVFLQSRNSRGWA